MTSFDLIVIGAGPGGYTAAFRAADLGLTGRESPADLDADRALLARMSERFKLLASAGKRLDRQATLRAGCTTDNGNIILDVRGLQITDPLAMETEVNQWPGVVTVGIFARHRARVCLLGTPTGVQRLSFD